MLPIGHVGRVPDVLVKEASGSKDEGWKSGDTRPSTEPYNGHTAATSIIEHWLGHD